MRWLAILLAVLVTACSSQSPEEKLLKSTDAAASWVPGLKMAAQKWASNSVPATFAGNASKAARKEFDKAQKAIGKSDASSELKRRLDSDFTDADHFAADLAAAVEHDERRSILPRLQKLDRLHDDLDQLKQQYGGGS